MISSLLAAILSSTLVCGRGAISQWLLGLVCVLMVFNLHCMFKLRRGGVIEPVQFGNGLVPDGDEHQYGKAQTDDG